jgi:protein tyrosine/serine phosphatase
MRSKESFRRATVLCLAATFTLASAYAASENQSLPNFQRVDDHVYRGAQPSNEGFKDLAGRGIKTVIDLREIGEHSQADEQKAVTDLGMRYVSIPMKGLSAPKDNLVAAVEAIFNDPAQGPVFVHCKRGADRTGLVVAVYRISHDAWDNAKALTEAKSLGMSFFERAIQHYVLDYKAQIIAAAVPAQASIVSGAGQRHYRPLPNFCCSFGFLATRR